jgi:hypothetical protein
MAGHFLLRRVFYFVVEGAAGEGAGDGIAGAGAVRVWPTVVPGAVLLADWLASRGHRNNAPTMSTAAAMAAIVPMPIPSARVPVVVRLSRSSLIAVSIMVAQFKPLPLENVPTKSAAPK